MKTTLTVSEAIHLVGKTVETPVPRKIEPGSEFLCYELSAFSRIGTRREC